MNIPREFLLWASPEEGSLFALPILTFIFFSTKSNLLGKLWKIIKAAPISSLLNSRKPIILQHLNFQIEKLLYSYKIFYHESVNEHRDAQKKKKNHTWER